MLMGRGSEEVPDWEYEVLRRRTGVMVTITPSRLFVNS